MYLLSVNQHRVNFHLKLTLTRIRVKDPTSDVAQRTGDAYPSASPDPIRSTCIHRSSRDLSRFETICDYPELFKSFQTKYDPSNLTSCTARKTGDTLSSGESGPTVDWQSIHVFLVFAFSFYFLTVLDRDIHGRF